MTTSVTTSKYDWVMANQQLKNYLGQLNAMDVDGWRPYIEEAKGYQSGRNAYTDTIASSTDMGLSIVRAHEDYVVGSGIVVKAHEDAPEGFQKRIDEALGTDASWLRFCTDMLAAMIKKSQAYIWVNTANNLQLLNADDVIGTIRDSEGGEVRYYRRKFTEYKYDKKSIVKKPYSSKTALRTEGETFVQDIPADRVVELAIFKEINADDAFGGLNSIATSLREYLAGKKNMINAQAKSGAMLAQMLVKENMGEEQQARLQAGLQGSMETNPFTGERELKPRTLLLAPYETTAVDFGSVHAGVTDIQDELQNNSLIPFGLSASAGWNNNANLATALAQQSPMYRAMSRIQAILDTGIRAALAIKLSKNDSKITDKSFEIQFTDPLSADFASLTKAVIALYEANLITQEEAVMKINGGDEAAAKKTVKQVKKEREENAPNVEARDISAGEPVKRERPNLRDKHSAAPSANI